MITYKIQAKIIKLKLYKNSVVILQVKYKKIRISILSLFKL